MGVVEVFHRKVGLAPPPEPVAEESEAEAESEEEVAT